MPAYFVETRTIDAVVTLMKMRHGGKLVVGETELGQGLWMMNAIALGAQYSTEDAGRYEASIAAYRYRPVEDADIATLLKSLHCFLYQCSEGKVRELALYQRAQDTARYYAAYRRTEAYERAPWGLS